MRKPQCLLWIGGGNARDAVLAKWLYDPANTDRVHDVLSTTCALGLDRFKRNLQFLKFIQR